MRGDDYEKSKHEAYAKATAWFKENKLGYVLDYFLNCHSVLAMTMLDGYMPSDIHLSIGAEIAFNLSRYTAARHLAAVARQARPAEYEKHLGVNIRHRGQQRGRGGATAKKATVFLDAPKPLELWAREAAHYGKAVRRQEDKRLRRANTELCALVARQFNSATTNGRWSTRFADLNDIG